MQWLLWIAPGIAAAVAGYVIYVSVTKGIPAAWTMLKNWWNKGKEDVQAIKADVDALKAGYETVKQKLGIQ